MQKLKETQDAMIMARDLLNSKIISENEFEKLAEAVGEEPNSLEEWENERKQLLSLGREYDTSPLPETKANTLPKFSSPILSENGQVVYSGRGSPASMALLEQEANDLAAEQDFYRRIAEAGKLFDLGEMNIFAVPRAFF